MGRVFRTTAVIGLAAGVLSGCATTRAAAPVERPALDVPVPPPRIIVPLPPPESPLPDPVQDLPGGGAAPAPSRPRPSREKEAPKPEAKPEETKPAEPTPPAPTAATPAPVPQLRIAESGDPAQLAGQIRAAIDRTLDILNGIDYRTLVKARQKAYDDSKLFATQADEALKIPNLVFAKELADKAERLAKELTGR